MNSPSNIYCLALYPRSEIIPLPDSHALQQGLLALGLLGESIRIDGEQRFKLGERFYQLLSFMGCAPALKLEADDPFDEKFCHFRFVEYPQTTFRFLRPEVKARCPHCRKPGDSASYIQELINKQLPDVPCPHCQQAIAINELNWKHEAGLGRYFIELIDVHPHEVVPTDGLLKQLQSVSGQQWDYFYGYSSPTIIT